MVTELITWSLASYYKKGSEIFRKFMDILGNEIRFGCSDEAMHDFSQNFLFELVIIIKPSPSVLSLTVGYILTLISAVGTYYFKFQATCYVRFIIVDFCVPRHFDLKLKI